METSNYPQYYRKEGLCLKRETDTTVMLIEIPTSDGQLVPTNHHPVIYPSKARLDEFVAGMQQVDQDVYESYLATYFQVNDKKRHIFNELKQKRYEAAFLKLSITFSIVARQFLQI